MTDWENATCNVADKPAELDTTSSKFFVYQRRNIQLVSFTDDEGRNFEAWVYEERKLTKDEYARLREQELAEELTQTQLALTEIYESVVTNNG